MLRRTVTSIRGNRYPLGRELGRGGQGAVYAVEGQLLAVKLLTDRSAATRDRLRDQLAMVGRLPLENLAVARPIEQLRPPDIGYVMELFTGMVPLGGLAHPPTDADSVARWYVQSGGLRRRLRLLGRTAHILSQLHGRGLVYVDPSPSNVFVSESVDAHEVRLIDTDNLRCATVPGATLFTPRYGAPELIRRSGTATSLSDAHAFATIAFETLALVHPFLGDVVETGPPDLEEEALSGSFPWIDDPEDGRNRSSHGIPRAHVLSENLRDAFHKTFSAGRSNAIQRPGLVAWAENLDRAADRTLVCPECASTYYFSQAACPWCDAPRPPVVIVAALLWDPDRLQNRGNGDIAATPGVVRGAGGKPKVVDAVVVSQGETRTLTARITHGTRSDSPQVEVAYRNGRVTLRAVAGDEWTLISSDGRTQRELRRDAVDIAIQSTSAGWLLHSGPKDKVHRFFRFDSIGGGNQ